MHDEKRIQQLRELIWDHYAQYGREMPWRDNPSPHNVVASEVMLQQTQVDRMRPKFQSWVQAWPDFGALSRATTEEVLRAWQGLGYNHRVLCGSSSLRRE